MPTNKRKPIDFYSNDLTASLVEEGYKAKPRWFDKVSGEFIEHFALAYGTKTWNVSPTGNDKAIVVSFPRHDGRVKMFDIDAGHFFWTKVGKLTRSRVSGRAKEWMYEANDVVMDDQRCESEEITSNIDWESLKEFDERGQTLGKGPQRIAEKMARMIRIPNELIQK